MTAATASPMLDAAFEYAARGLAVFPVWGAARGRCCCGLSICDSPGKHPIARCAPRGFLDATTDKATIESWWQQHPNANIGAPTGVWSDVIDVDPRHGGDERLAALEREHGPLPDTAEVLTGGGGRHIHFRPGRAPLGKQVAEGIDVKGPGGYVLLPPSSHVSG